MLLDICLGTKSAWRILSVLAEAPGKAVERKEIQKLTKMGNKMLSKFLIILEKFDIILASKIGKKGVYKLNLSSPFTTQIIELIKTEKKELNSPDFSIMAILREFIYELTNLNIEEIQKIILFGSYAKRTYHEQSDIDVAIVLKEKDIDIELLITNITANIKNRFKKEIQPHYFTEQEFKNTGNKIVEEIRKDGIKLL
jgi:predicted nucleotidyltransferase